MTPIEQLRTDIREAIKTALEVPLPPLTVQLEVKGIADGLNNPEVFRHIKPAAPTEPPPIEEEITLAGISPNTGVVGTDLVLAVSGTNFKPTSTVEFDTDPVPTTFVSATELTANIAAADNDVVDTFDVTVDGVGPLSFEVTDVAGGLRR